MKKKRILLAYSLFAILALIAGITYLIAPEVFSDLFIGIGGTLLAAAPAAAVDGATAEQTQVGSVGTNVVENGKVVSHPEMNKPTISQKLSQIMPSNTPLDTFLRNIGSGRTSSDKFEFYSIVARGLKCKVKSTVEAEDESPVKIALSEGCHSLSKDGDLLVPDYNVAAGAATKVSEGIPLHPLVLHIVAIDYAGKEITVVGVNAKCPALEADTVMYRMASAKDQDAAMSEDPMATPTKDANWCQRNLCTISENAFQALQEKEVQYGMAEFKEQAIVDFRLQAELSSIFGAGFYGDPEFVDPISQKRKLHMRGLLDFNINNIPRDSGEDVTKYLNRAMEKIFSNNNGSETRLLLYGPGFATKMANSGSWQKQLEAGKTEVKFGIKWNVIESNFGTLLAIMHKSFGLIGPYKDAALVIDPANIRRIDQKPLEQTVLKLKEAGIRNSHDVTLDEAWTLEVTNPLTHGLLVM